MSDSLTHHRTGDPRPLCHRGSAFRFPSYHCYSHHFNDQRCVVAIVGVSRAWCQLAAATERRLLLDFHPTIATHIILTINDDVPVENLRSYCKILGYQDLGLPPPRVSNSQIREDRGSVELRTSPVSAMQLSVDSVPRHRPPYRSGSSSSWPGECSSCTSRAAGGDDGGTGHSPRIDAS